MVFYLLCHSLCCVPVCFLSHTLFICLTFCLDFSSSVISPPMHVCPIISSLSLYLRACALLCSYLPGIPCLYLPQSPPVLMSSFPDEVYGCGYVALRVNAPMMSKCDVNCQLNLYKAM